MPLEEGLGRYRAVFPVFPGRACMPLEATAWQARKAGGMDPRTPSADVADLIAQLRMALVGGIAGSPKKCSMIPVEAAMASATPLHDSVAVHSITVAGPPQRVQVQASNAELLELIGADSSLSAETRQGYTRALQRIYAGGPGRRGSPAFAPLLPKVSLFWLIKHPQEATSRLQGALAARGVNAPTTLKNYTDALMAVARRHPVLSRLAEVRGAWKAVAETQSATIRKRLSHNEPTERQREAFVPYPEIRAKLRELHQKDPGGRDTLLLGLLGLSSCSVGEQWLPQRADWGDIRIFKHPARPTATEAAEINHMVLESPEKGHIVLAHYKTAKTYGTRVIAMPPVFAQMVSISLQQDPRGYLFTTRTGEPYTGATFSCWANRRLHELFGRPLTLSGVRHSYISWTQCSQQWVAATDAEREALAKCMGHSLATAGAYRFAARHLQGA